MARGSSRLMFHETGEMPKGAMYVHQSSDMECSSHKVKYESLYERTKLINKIILIRICTYVVVTHIYINISASYEFITSYAFVIIISKRNARYET